MSRGFKGWLALSWLCFIHATAHGQYQLNGTASQISCNCYELTPNSPGSGGSVWNIDQIDLSNPQDFNFQVWLGCDEWGADGIGFVLQPVNVNQGGAGGSLGFGGIVPSLVVEVDTWPNDQTLSDPQEDHIAILQNGDPNHGSSNNLAGPVVASSTQNNIEDCAWHDFRVVWNPALMTFTVYFDGVFRTSYTGDIINDIFNGDPNVYWGWTGGTGGAAADQRFCNAILPNYILTSSATCVGDQIAFEDASLTASGNISNYDWDFGDGTTASGPTATHTYSTAGTFNVSLSITTEGCVEDTIIPIEIDPTPVVDLGPDLSTCSGENIQLNNPNMLGSGTYAWMPPTALSNPSAPSPTTSTNSTTNYSLTFTSNNGCSGSDEIQVVVNQLPIANAGNDQTICQNESAQLQAGGGVSYAWSPQASISDPTIANPLAIPQSTTTYSVEVTDANNCTATDEVTITVVPAPLLDAGNNEAICEGDTAQLNASGNGSFSWSPAAGLSNATSQDPVAYPNITTVYHVTLTDANNCSSIDSVIVDVEPIPVADFNDPVPACDGSSVQFNDNSTGTLTTYLWDFGDGQFGSGPDPTHTYPGIGTYNVTLNVTSVNGCGASASGTATVVDGPTPDYSIVNGPELCVNEPLDIVDNSTGPIASYDWDFGEGTSSGNELPVHSYNTPGSYTVTLTLTAPDQCANSQSVDVQVYPIPQSDFGFSSACEGQATEFIDQSTVSSGSVVGWEWDFGDGSTLESIPDPSHAYASTGTYGVTLVTETAFGCMDTTLINVSVNPTPVVSISAGNGCLGDSVQFVNNTVPFDNTIAQWNWLFGDGQSSSEPIPNHVYSGLGVFDVQLTATTDSGCSGTGTTQLEVYPYPETNFSWSDQEGCAPIDVVFTDESTIVGGYSVGAYQWNFGNGTYSVHTNPTQTFGNAGSYDISLITITEGGGCADTLTLNDLLTIYSTPEASFYHSPTDASMLDPRIRFTNTSIDATSYIWEFGDQNVSTLVHPVNQYALEGDYLVTLTAINGICSSMISQNVHIDPETFIYIPNSFTPNGDGLNDVFVPKGIGIEDFNMIIFDRWGKQLYQTNSLDAPWTGWLNGLELPSETYVFRVEILNVKGEVEKFSGHVNLVR